MNFSNRRLVLALKSAWSIRKRSSWRKATGLLTLHLLRKRSSSRNDGVDVYATTLRSAPKYSGSNLPPIREDRSTLLIENQSFVSSSEDVFIPAFSFPGFDSIPGVILAKHRPKFPTALRGLLAKPLLKQDR